MQRAVLIAAVLSGVVALSRENFQFGGFEDELLDQELLRITTAPPAIPSLPDADVAVPDVLSVPTACRCIVAITVAYIFVFAALAVTRTCHEVSATPRGNLEASLKAACQTLSYGPMVCVLFLAYEMRVESLSDGKGYPQIWAQYCMYTVTVAVIGSAVAVLVIPLLFGKPMPLIPGTFVIVTPRAPDFYKIGWSALRYLILLGLCGGLAGVGLGIWLYIPPNGSGSVNVPKPAPAIMCTMMVTSIFFLTQLAIAACRTITEFKGHETAVLVGIMNGAASTVEFGPMLCILFLSARMHASQHGSKPQAWAEFCMFAATGALGFASLLAVAVPIVLGGAVTINPRTREARIEVPHRMLGIMLLACRYLAMLSFFCGTAGVAASMFFFVGPEHTLPIPPTLRCVFILAVQFFTIYLVMIVVITTFELSEGYLPMESCACFACLEAAKGTVQLAPILSILFLATRMYALLITDEKGAPQKWVQDAMYLATWSLFVAALACLATGPAMGKVEQNERGDITNKVQFMCLALPMLLLRYLCMTVLYGSIAATILGLFVMVPRTANGQGSIPDVLNAVRSIPDVLNAVHAARFPFLAGHQIK